MGIKNVALTQMNLLRQVSADLVIGLVGIPLALAYQNVGKTILCMESLPYILYVRIAISFSYLFMAYVLISFAIVDLVHHPENWGGKSERFFRAVFMLPALLCLGVMGLVSEDLLQTKIFITLAFVSLSFALLPDIIRGDRMINQKYLLIKGWGIAGVLYLLWNIFFDGFMSIGL